MNKYGIESFKVETIEQCNETIVNERETYWIDKLDSFHNGYNATTGGDGKRYVDYEMLYQKWIEGKNEKEIQELTGHDTQSIRIALKEHGVTEKEIKERANSRMYKPVAMINKDTGEVLKTFSCVREAIIAVGKPSNYGSHICDVCKGKRKTAYGYKWKYID